MDRKALERLIAAAERRAAKGERHLERQRAVLNFRRRRGWNTNEAEAHLVAFELEETVHRADVERLRERLAATQIQ